MPYTQKETDQLLKLYAEGYTVKKLAVRLNKTPKSIIAKLSKLGVYESSGYRTKSGEVPIFKEELVAKIEHLLGEEFPGLEKTPKETLKKIILSLETLFHRPYS